jgi:hypothetical protein
MLGIAGLWRHFVGASIREQGSRETSSGKMAIAVGLEGIEARTSNGENVTRGWVGFDQSLKRWYAS